MPSTTPESLPALGICLEEYEYPLPLSCLWLQFMRHPYRGLGSALHRRVRDRVPSYRWLGA
jgi:hypothetical protein